MNRILFILFVCVSQISYGQSTKAIPIDSLNFNGLYANKINDNHKVSYWLCGLNAVNGPKKNYNSLLEQWLMDHPHAYFKPISYALVGKKDAQNSVMIHGWVVDKRENLNVFLVKNGGIKADAMTKFLEYKDLTEEQKQKFDWVNSENLKSLVSTKEYNKYLKKLYKAEQNARRKKRGIWQNTQ